MKATQLLAAVSNINGGSFIGLDTLTEVKLTGGKKNPQQGRVTKEMSGAQVMAFQNKNINGYEAMIQRRLVAEGKDPASFELGERAWGTRVPNLPIVEHEKDGIVKYYLEVVFLRPGAVIYRLDGRPIAEADIEGLPVIRDNPDSQASLVNKVIIRTFAADSITAVRIDGTEYK
jgi:hypothetical protein